MVSLLSSFPNTFPVYANDPADWFDQQKTLLPKPDHPIGTPKGRSTQLKLKLNQPRNTQRFNKRCPRKNRRS